MYSGRTFFRAKPFRLLWTGILPIALAGIAWGAFHGPADTWIGWFLTAFAAMSVFGLIEALTDFVSLETDQLRFRKTFRTRVVPKKDIQKASWTKGGGASIKTRVGTWIMVPDLGHDSQGMANSLRTWLNAD